VTKIACFVERYSYIDYIRPLRRFKDAAERLGHDFEIIEKRNLYEIPKFDALFLRTTTDPRYPAYVASKIAWERGMTVIDEPAAIIACSNKAHVYEVLKQNGIPQIPTRFLFKNSLDSSKIQETFDAMGRPLVLKAPYTAFSRYVEKTEDEDSFMQICRRYFRISDIVLAQRFIPTPFDWRIGVLDNQVLFACKYYIPEGRWKHGTRTKGGILWGETEAIKRDTIEPKLREIAIRASKPFGRGLFGIDIKKTSGEFIIVEVNDNATIYADEEDKADKDIYDKIIDYLAQGKR